MTGANYKMVKLTLHNLNTGLGYSWVGTGAEINRLVSDISSGKSPLGSCPTIRAGLKDRCTCRIQVRVEDFPVDLTKRLGACGGGD